MKVKIEIEMDTFAYSPHEVHTVEVEGRGLSRKEAVRLLEGAIDLYEKDLNENV